MECTRLSLGGSSARVARAADPIFARASGADLGWAASTACDVMSGAGAGPVLRVCIASGCQGAGRPDRWLVTVTGEPFSSVANATNIKKGRTDAAAFRLHAPQHSE